MMGLILKKWGKVDKMSLKEIIKICADCYKIYNKNKGGNFG